MNDSKFEVVVGASGRWVARRVIEQYANGKVKVGGPSYTGHVPVRKMGHAAARAVIERQLRRKIATGETARPGDGPRGGTAFIVTL